MVKMTAVIKAKNVKTVVIVHVKATIDRLSVKKPPQSEGVMVEMNNGLIRRVLLLRALTDLSR
jgi:hypothetical protein